jgi:mannosyltransferase OCH1-like enzyme
MLWNLNEALAFVKKHYTKYYSFMVCETNKPIIKCDFFRYLILYHFGGIYMDLDFMTIRNLDELYMKNAANDIILTRESFDCVEKHQTLHNGFIISKKIKSEFFKRMLEDIISVDIRHVNEQDVYTISGTKLICHHWLKYKSTENIFVLPFHIVCSHIFRDNDTFEITLFNGNNLEETILNKNCSWTHLSIKNVFDYKEELKKNGAFAVCSYMSHGSYWK